VATAVKVQWLWDIRYIDAPVLRWRDTGGDPDLDETLYYCNDANMNVTALVNTSGAVVERYMYDPYGKPTFLKADWTLQDGDAQHPAGTISAYANEILYCGYRWNPETGAYDVRHRVYWWHLGRWGQWDEIGYGDDINLYLYGRDNPATSVDPEGTRCGDCCPPNPPTKNIYDPQFKAYRMLNPRGNPGPLDACIDACDSTEILKIVPRNPLGEPTFKPDFVKNKAMEIDKKLKGGGVSLWIKIKFKSCDECSKLRVIWEVGPGGIFIGQLYDWQWHDYPKDKWHKCTQGSGRFNQNAPVTSQAKLWGPGSGAYNTAQEALDNLDACVQSLIGDLYRVGP